MSIRISRYPVCRHTLTTGRRCKSPALTSSAFCHHHRRLRQARYASPASTPALLDFAPDALRDSASIQRALAQLFHGVASGKLPLRPAGQLLHALQLAIGHQKN